MIKFTLRCYNGHEFDSWFPSSESYAQQQEMDLVACPTCGICEVSKAITAPNIITKPSHSVDPDYALRATLREITAYVKANCEDVKDKFPEEARRMHYGDSEPRSICGNATLEEAKELHDEGIDILVLPELSTDA